VLVLVLDVGVGRGLGWCIFYSRQEGWRILALCIGFFLCLTFPPTVLSSSKGLSKMKSVAALASLAVVAAQGRPHPRLAEDWKATVLQPGLGVVYESYTMVGSPDYSFENPSGLWTNYTDDSCKRLIFVPNNAQARRYYLKCYALDCCYSSQSGNHVELQIPNIYPAQLPGQPAPEPWPVEDYGTRNITTYFGTYTADAWFWEFAQARQTFIAYTIPCEVSESCPTGVKLVRWHTTVFGTEYDVDFDNDYIAFAPQSPSYEAHKDTFYIPPQCTGNQVRDCNIQAQQDERNKLHPWMPVRIIVDENGKRIN
jgi:hypothetical protein